MTSQCKTSNLIMVYPEDFDPYPGAFLKADLEEKIYRSSMMLSAQYLAVGDSEASAEALRNIYISKHDAKPDFDAFAAYLETQRAWESVIKLVRRERYAVRAVLERNNMSAPEIRLDKEHRRELSRDEILQTIRKLPTLDSFTQAELDTLIAM